MHAPPDKSTGLLYPNDNPVYNAPGMTGKIKITRELLETWLEQIGDKETVIACGAIWLYLNDGKKFVSFEISPYFAPKAKKRPAPNQRKESIRVPVDTFFADVPDLSNDHQSES